MYTNLTTTLEVDRLFPVGFFSKLFSFIIKRNMSYFSLFSNFSIVRMVSAPQAKANNG